MNEVTILVATESIRNKVQIVKVGTQRKVVEEVCVERLGKVNQLCNLTATPRTSHPVPDGVCRAFVCLFRRRRYF